MRRWRAFGGGVFPDCDMSLCEFPMLIVLMPIYHVVFVVYNYLLAVALLCLGYSACRSLPFRILVSA